MQAYHILWADDEIDLLKPHILFLKQKGYEVTPACSGSDALDLFQDRNFDIVFLDENMPGMSGLETLAQMKNLKPHIPVVMVTKSEEERIMEEAIGSHISDYLIKPINPNQLLLSVKKILENKRIITEKTNLGYQQDFRNLSMAFNERLNFEEWTEVYKKLVHWELALEQASDKSMQEVLEMQKSEANTNFVRFIQDNYEEWLNNPNIERPLLSHQLFRKKIFPELGKSEKIFFILIDNLRYDQWRVLAPIIGELFNIEEESLYYSILPTTTAYARNAIFAGMLPTEIAKNFPQYWKDEEDEEGKNLYEDIFLQKQFEKNKIQAKVAYHKIITNQQGRSLVENYKNLLHNDFVAIVYNFVDMLSHARTDLQMIRELAPDEPAYRSLTKSWFLHSPLWELLQKIAREKVRVIITTDHGTIRVKRPFKIVGDKSVNTNLRYKQGKNLSYEGKDIFEIRKPEKLFLPKPNISTSYVFAVEDYFFAYPNNYNYYVSYFKDTFQHGGISLEEMIIPFVWLSPK
ncbi:T9SS response regulator signal transducer PorX [Raineya orbicola]|jgi:DNA-binding response OmpR family regulator|uniref:PglZ domain n=1 Tax=Raineya orbicola TaxID=2016530 RepID=A0A2N3IJI3_9BACT|nr:bifunctional response regulator/alkaline phosphatase family protein [Raineya orbicola]PKQ70466.1 PglZ domain [Raineya orbicola]